MKKICIIIIIIPFLLSCEKETSSLDSFIIARIVGYDLNCSTCIIEFPKDSIAVKKEIGKSQSNYYQALNLNKNNFEIGQQIKVKVRISKTNELVNCITLYAAYNYKSLIIEEYKDFENLAYNDTVNLAFQDCFSDFENKFYLCFDSVVNDSRCPIGAMCFLAGIAGVKLKFQKYNEAPIFFELITPGATYGYKIIDGIKFTLIDLIPYPSLRDHYEQNGYKANLIVTKEQ
jgi:hypothetical protein